MQRASDILSRFWNNPEHQRELRLAALWPIWSAIVGPEVAELAKPLGHNKTTLLLGVEDSMAMQELSFQTPRILQTVNASLGEAYFDKVRLDLIGSRTCLDTVAGSLPKSSDSAALPFARSEPKPTGLGEVQGVFSGIPALDRCYKAYVRLFGGSQEKLIDEQSCNTGGESKKMRPDS